MVQRCNSFLFKYSSQSINILLSYGFKMNNNTKLAMMTILTAGILMTSFMLANINPTFAKKNKQCVETETYCQTIAKNMKSASTSGEKGKDGAKGITITDNQVSNDSNVLEEKTQLDNSTSISSNASASTSAIDNSGAANPFGLPM